MEQLLEKEIIEWHIATFPDCTLENQILKFQEERQEMEQANNYKTYTEELADCYICVLPLGRYGEVGNVIKDVALGYLNQIRENHKSWFIDKYITISFIQNKMEKNRKRKWELINGVYKHIK